MNSKGKQRRVSVATSQCCWVAWRGTCKRQQECFGYFFCSVHPVDPQPARKSNNLQLLVWSELLALLFDAFARCLQRLSPWCLMGAGASSHDSPHFPRGCTAVCQASVTWVRQSLIQCGGLRHAEYGGRMGGTSSLFTDEDGNIDGITEKHNGSK